MSILLGIRTRRSPLSIAVAAIATGWLTAAVTIDTPPSDDNAPGVDQAREDEMFGESGISPARNISDLLPRQRDLDNRIQALIQIARREMARPEPKKRKTNRRDATTGSALLTLGLLYYHGIELPQDPGRAMELFIRSRLLGNSPAAIALAWCYLDGCGTAPNDLAFEKIMRAVKTSNRKRANFFLYEQTRRRSDTDPALSSEAEKYLRAATIAGDRFALNELGLLEIERGEFSEAIKAFSAAAAAGSQVAQRALKMRSTGIGTVTTVASVEKPSADTEALYRQARELHRTGTSLSDYARVIELYRAAAQQRHRQAAQMLSLILSRPTPDGTIDPVWMKQTSLVRLDDGSAAVIGVSGEIYEREPSPIMDLLPPSFTAAE